MAQAVDVVVIGSGFGGSVAALRLAEKGYRVLVLEKGRRFGPETLPKTNWNLRRWLWAPWLGCRGVLKLTFFRQVTVLSGVGVGGGSLVYANTLAQPKQGFFQSPSWAHLADWQAELEPFYHRARQMLGAAPNPQLQPGDLALQRLGEELGRAEAFRPTDVGVYFGNPQETVPDPYFNGQGPPRTGCCFCGNCMVGCRFDAKNTLDKNYLHLAQAAGAEVRSQAEVFDLRPQAGGYLARWKGLGPGASSGEVLAQKVVFAGGVLGSLPLLLKLKQTSLPRLSDQLGRQVRTNSEALIFSTALKPGPDCSQGVAIGSILETDAHSHLEVVRYGKGSGFWRLMSAPMVSGRGAWGRLAQLGWDLLRRPWANVKALAVGDWARSTHVLLFMQTLEGTLRFKRGWFGRMCSALDGGAAPTAAIPEAQDLARRFGELTNAKPMAPVTETLLGIPTTAHILGGAVMGRDASEGVIDKDHRVFGYENLYICDGSSISANLGVNPSLTITALTERAMSKIPPKGA